MPANFQRDVFGGRRGSSAAGRRSHLSTERPGPTPSSGLLLDSRYDSLSKMDEATDKAATFWLIFFSSVTMAVATNLRIWWGRWKVTVAHWKRPAGKRENPDEAETEQVVKAVKTTGVKVDVTSA